MDTCMTTVRGFCNLLVDLTTEGGFYFPLLQTNNLAQYFPNFSAIEKAENTSWNNCNKILVISRKILKTFKIIIKY